MLYTFAFILILFAAAIFLLLAYFHFVAQQNEKKPKEPFPDKWKPLLKNSVTFYRNLSSDKKAAFEQRIMAFINHVKITGVSTPVEDKDRLLVAASAVIPTFSFPNWCYPDLKEVILYPNSFNESYSVEGEKRNISGMVGNGVIKDKVIFSKPALHQGFSNVTDKKNVGIHEFVHLIDKADGNIDGIPEVILSNQYVIPWVKLIKEKVENIRDGNSDINPYGATSDIEFLTVVSEYFFERPKLLRRKHPKLYNMLQTTYKQKPNDYLSNVNNQNKDIGRNAPCSCGSGRKYKVCCLSK